MNVEPNNFSVRPVIRIFSAILIIAFGWSMTLVGSQGTQLVMSSDKSILATKSFLIKNSPSKTDSTSSLTANTLNSVQTSTTSAGYAPTAPSIPSTNPTEITSNISSSSSLTIVIGGDAMFDRGVRRNAQKYGYDSLFSSSTSQLFKQADIVAVNLEGPITSSPSKTLLLNGSITKELSFTFNPKTADALANIGIDAVSLANNHTDNFGTAGLAETKKLLTKSNIQYFGDPRNASSTEIIITKNGITVALVGYHGFQPGFDRVLQSVKRLSDLGYFVIVMPHWGNEYSTSSSSFMRSQARSLVAAGASAIVGMHPHVVLEHSYMGNVPVFYSLGNLIFDQYFSPEVMTGNVVELKISKNTRDATDISDQNNSHTLTKIDRINIYQTSTANKRSVTLDTTPMDF
jgi:poly-gamma-glutamate synthesis protein (capsule biosynthesis protein)